MGVCLLGAGASWKPPCPQQGERGEKSCSWSTGSETMRHLVRDWFFSEMGNQSMGGFCLFGWFLLQPGFYFTKLSSLYFSESILVPLPGSPDCKPCPGFYPSFRHSPPLSLILPRSSFHLCVLSREVMRLLLTF